MAQLTQEQLLELHSMDQDVVRDVVSVVKHNDTYYHLNPDLVPDPNAVTLCGRCMRDPYNNKYSIASGHDYGRRSKFPDLSGITLSTVVPVRKLQH